MGNAVKILALEGHAHVLLLRSPNETVVYFRHSLLMSRCVWINILNAGIVACAAEQILDAAASAKGERKDKHKQKR